MASTTAKFMGPMKTWGNVILSLDDRSAMGGRAVVLTGDGYGMVTVEQLDNETVYAIQPGKTAVMQLLRAVRDLDVLALDDYQGESQALARLSIVVNGDQERTVKQCLGSGAAVGFVAVYEAVGALLDALPAEKSAVLLTDAAPLAQPDEAEALQQLADETEGALRSFGWQYERQGDKFMLPYRTPESERMLLMTLHARAVEGERRIMCYTYWPTFVPLDKLPAVMEFITRANYGLVLGNFELDLRDGELRYKASVSVTGLPVDRATLWPSAITAVSMLDRYTPGIEAVLAGQTPAAAIAQIEARA